MGCVGKVCLGVEALRPEGVAVVVVVLAFPAVCVAPVHLTTGPGEEPPVVVVGEHGNAVDGDGDRPRVRHAGDVVQRIRDGVRLSGGYLCRIQGDFEHVQLRRRRSHPAGGIPTGREGGGFQVQVAARLPGVVCGR